MAKPSSISLTILIAELLYSLIIDLTIAEFNLQMQQNSD